MPVQDPVTRQIYSPATLEYQKVTDSVVIEILRKDDESVTLPDTLSDILDRSLVMTS